jgi:hypothetical protein
MNKFREWYLTNYNAITWFIIGFLSMDVLVQLSRDNIAGAGLSALLVALNYFFVKRN